MSIKLVWLTLFLTLDQIINFCPEESSIYAMEKIVRKYLEIQDFVRNYYI